MSLLQQPFQSFSSVSPLRLKLRKLPIAFLHLIHKSVDRIFVALQALLMRLEGAFHRSQFRFEVLRVSSAIPADERHAFRLSNKPSNATFASAVSSSPFVRVSLCCISSRPFRTFVASR